jgi:hypothetical protein
MNSFKKKFMVILTTKQAEKEMMDHLTIIQVVLNGAKINTLMMKEIR